MAGRVQKKIALEMAIRQVVVNIEDLTGVQVVWMRGKNRAEIRHKEN